MRAALARRGLDTDWRVESAGTSGGRPDDMVPTVAKVLRERGADPSGFRSRRLSTPMVQSASLILTATRIHRAAVAQLDPGSTDRVFTLREFARLMGSLPASVRSPASGPDPTALVRAMEYLQPGHRGGGRHDDLADPIGMPLVAVRRCADIIEQSIMAILGPATAAAPLGRRQAIRGQVACTGDGRPVPVRPLRPSSTWTSLVAGRRPSRWASPAG